MNSEEQPPAPAVNPFVRWFVVGLPLGLFIMGALSFVLYFQKKNAAEHPGSSRFASMLRKEVNLEDYRRYLDVFKQTIGPRTADKPGNIEAAESYIKSTMGYDNMGYQVVRREVEINGKVRAHFIVEITGKKSPETVALITARYDGERSEDMAALLVMAHAFTGTEHRNTIRFAAVYGDDESGIAASEARHEFKLSGPAINDPDALDQLHAVEKKITAMADAAD